MITDIQHIKMCGMQYEVALRGKIYSHNEFVRKEEQLKISWAFFQMGICT